MQQAATQTVKSVWCIKEKRSAFSGQLSCEILLEHSHSVLDCVQTFLVIIVVEDGKIGLHDGAGIIHYELLLADCFFKPVL